ncbi:MAG: head GIN domain-containing protein [Opitutales bacterium]
MLAALGPYSHGRLTKDSKLLRHFDRIEVRGAVNVYAKQEKRLRVATVYTDDSVLDSVVTEVRGRTLVVEADNVGKYAPRLPFVKIEFKAIQPVEVIISIKELQGVTVAGEGSFTGTNLHAKNFQVFSVGAGKVHLENLTADEVEVRIESDGDVILKGGVVERLRANLRGKGSLHAIDLPALRAHVFISGTGNASVRAENWLEAKLSGKGNLRYLGRPLNLFVQTDGTGQVERIDPPEDDEVKTPRQKTEKFPLEPSQKKEAPKKKP